MIEGAIRTFLAWLSLVAAALFAFLEFHAVPRSSWWDDSCPSPCRAVEGAAHAAAYRAAGIGIVVLFLVICSSATWGRETWTLASARHRGPLAAALPVAALAGVFAALAFWPAMLAFWMSWTAVGIVVAVAALAGASAAGAVIASQTGLGPRLSGRIGWLAALTSALFAVGAPLAVLSSLWTTDAVGLGSLVGLMAGAGSLGAFVATWLGVRAARGGARVVRPLVVMAALAVVALVPALVAIHRDDVAVAKDREESARVHEYLDAHREPSASVPPGSGPAPSPEDTSMPATGAAAAHACTAEDLRVELDGWDAAMGSRFVRLRATNTSEVACAVDGIPPVRISQGGRELHLAYTPGAPGVGVGRDRPQRVGIAPGRSASAVLSWRGYGAAADQRTPQQLVATVVPGHPVPVKFTTTGPAPFDLVDDGKVQVSAWAAD